MSNLVCPIESLLEIVEGKWTLLLLHHLFNGVKRFGELRSTLHPISPKTLTDRLRLLEERHRDANDVLGSASPRGISIDRTGTTS